MKISIAPCPKGWLIFRCFTLQGRGKKHLKMSCEKETLLASCCTCCMCGINKHFTSALAATKESLFFNFVLRSKDVYIEKN